MALKVIEAKSRNLEARALCVLGCGTSVRNKGGICKSCRKAGARRAAKADYQQRKAQKQQKSTGADVEGSES